MSEEYKYNLLTQELLLQGYTTENHPDYVRIGIGKMGKSPLKFGWWICLYRRVSGRENFYVRLWAVCEMGKLYRPLGVYE